ncbi:MAG: type I restriction enzyme HsdR N-terminal domain-containing protein [Phaeodactylibacter sp.]|uniref:type I restriction enzyme HsdR N-terminal domain-containing protein n=1 Tax=Phaeodactylibacter sp. TaxID=1940289 RepID=UPI0032EDF153
MLIHLDLLRYKDQLRVRRKDDKRYIFDRVRKKWLVLQPEELVRQLMLEYLLLDMGYNPNRIAMEKGLKVNTLDRRYDLLVYDKGVAPYLLIECKAPQVKITQAVFEQVSWYNSSLQVPYMMVTNGMETYCCLMDYEAKSYRFLEAVPDPA